MGASASHLVATGKGLEYAHTVLNSFGLRLDGFSAFNKGQLLDVQRKSVLEKMQNIPGLELFASRILNDNQTGVEAVAGEVAADGNQDPEAGHKHEIERIHTSKGVTSFQKKVKRDNTRGEISAILWAELNKFRDRPLMVLPVVKQLPETLEKMGLELVLPEEYRFEDVFGENGKKRKREEDMRLLEELTRSPPTIYLRRKLVASGETRVEGGQVEDEEVDQQGRGEEGGNPLEGDIDGGDE